MFYADTATFGARAAMECGLDFFGSDHVLFASDMPFDPEKGSAYIAGPSTFWTNCPSRRRSAARSTKAMHAS